MLLQARSEKSALGSAISFCFTHPGSRPARGTKGKAVRIGHGPATVSGGPCLFARCEDSRVKPLPEEREWGGKVKQGRERAASQETCLGVRGHIASW